jgi:hypothetical protein
MRKVLRQLAAGDRLIDDCFGARLERTGVEVSRVTMRALVHAGLVIDPVPLFEREAGRLTRHGEAWARREWGKTNDA